MIREGQGASSEAQAATNLAYTDMAIMPRVKVLSEALDGEIPPPLHPGCALPLRRTW